MDRLERGEYWQLLHRLEELSLILLDRPGVNGLDLDYLLGFRRGRLAQAVSLRFQITFRAHLPGVILLDFALASDTLEGFLDSLTLPRGFRLCKSALARLILSLLACHKVLFHDLLQVHCLCSGEGGA